jgi:N-acylglucosamine 2-epimerase
MSYIQHIERKVMDRKRIDELAGIYQDGLLNDIVPFWMRHSIDYKNGGYLTYLDRDGSVYCTDKPIWLQGRMIWMFSRLYNDVDQRQEWLDLAEHGLRFLLKSAFDSDGRMFFMVDKDGQPLRKRRYLFSEAFAVMGLAEYALATGDDSMRQKAANLFDLMLHYYQTPGLLEPKDIPGARPSKSHAMPMILLAVTQVMRKVDDRPIYTEIADRYINEILNDFCKPDIGALLETVGPNGEFIDTPDGRCVNPGHAIETSWFIMEEGRNRGDMALVQKGLQILEWSLNRGWDQDYGGILYYADIAGKPCVQYEWDMKLWWPHTEALYATLLAYHITGDIKWLDWYNRIHDYTFSHFPDTEYGEWYGYLHRDGSVSHRLKGNCWKGPFHISRCQMLCSKLLQEM